MARTKYPCSSNRITSHDPINPAAPVTQTVADATPSIVRKIKTFQEICTGSKKTTAPGIIYSGENGLAHP